MNSFFENPGLSHIGIKILASLDFTNQANYRQVCRLWNQIIEDLFSKMIPKISLTQLNLLLNQFLDRIAAPDLDKIKWIKFLKISYSYFENTDYNNRLFKLYMRHFLNNPRKKYCSRVNRLICSPIQVFTFLGNIKMVNFMIKNEVAKIHNFDWTILHEAVERGHTEMVKYLVHGSFFDRPLRITESQHRWNPIHLASKNGNLEIMKILTNWKPSQSRFCQSKSIMDVSEYSQDNSKNSPLHLALKNGHFDMVKFLIENVEARFIGVSDDFRRNAIHTAAKIGHVEILKMLYRKIEYKGKVFLKDWVGNTPLHLAAEFGHFECIKFLMKFEPNWHIAKSSRNKYGSTPFDLAEEKGFLEIVEYLNSVVTKTNCK